MLPHVKSKPRPPGWEAIVLTTFLHLPDMEARIISNNQLEFVLQTWDKELFLFDLICTSNIRDQIISNISVQIVLQTWEKELFLIFRSKLCFKTREKELFIIFWSKLSFRYDRSNYFQQWVTTLHLQMMEVIISSI